ncbi:type I secretion system permease/ATPase [Agrobacterium tumefaciens]|uniref:type I secretion system permease/ATPase n=1 Tax=Agrobacterium tumefaciens TaxID=358 RepID=UPI0021CE3301|nr:type I secretion system permease/ATPase [Agrobacterium tumefaciens]UXS05273.1 type I secretion system permease/ATPase [Agrobacterium tumefaciens]
MLSLVLGVGLASGVVNALYLTGSFFMLEVYDRVLPSHSIPSLVALAILALGLYLYQGLLEIVRGRLLVRFASLVDEKLYKHVYRLMIVLPLSGKRVDTSQPLRDFDQVKSFLQGTGPSSLFDLPWLPFYIAICFLFHPVVGWFAVGGSIVLIGLTIANHFSTRHAAQRTNEITNRRNAFVFGSQRGAEVLRSMGMIPRMTEVWDQTNRQLRIEGGQASDITYIFGTVTKVFRTALQSAVLAAGAVLAIQGEASGGIIIASSILTARAFAPLEMAIANWRGFVAARQSWGRLRTLMELYPEQSARTTLAPPSKSLSVERLTGFPIGDRFAFSDVEFTVNAGSAVGVIGPSASGKSSLARVLLGIWEPVRGVVRLDGASLDQWDQSRIGRFIGYLPQDVQLFSGTVAENISRFEDDASADEIIAAAKAARVHDMVLNLPQGYDTHIGDAGSALSAGQRQRLALARALYREPFLIVLDEPNSNLDAEGEQALIAAIDGVKARGGIAIIIAHRPSVLANVDLILMMRNGQMHAFGPKDEVLARVMAPVSRPRGAPLKVIGETGEAGE